MKHVTTLLAAVSACALLGTSPAPQSDSSTPAPVVIHIKNFAFSPAKVSIKTGQSIQWINDDQVDHSATADDNSFNSGELDQGKSWTNTFSKAGTFKYHCDDHPNMKAEIDVADNS